MKKIGAISSPVLRGRIRDRSGFTLIEVTLALMLIAVLAALGLPGLVRATGPATLRIAALQVAALLREDRNVAIKTGRPVTSVVDARDVRSGASPASIVLPVGTEAAVVDAKIPGVRFYGDGHASGATIVIASSVAQVRVSVSPDTGAIHVGAP